MSIIQQIRERYAAVGFGAIALSLIAFILMDAGKSGSGGNVTASDAIGKVNGENISYGAFLERAKQTERVYEMNGRVVDENTRQQIYSDSWQSIIDDELLRQQSEELGLTVTDKEFNDMLYGSNPPQDLKQAFTNPQTGEYDVAAAKQRFAEMKKATGEQRQQLEDFFNALISNREKEKYAGLVQNSAYVPTWMAEKTIADNNSIATFSYVTIPYNTIADSSVTITDEQINAYVKAHPKEFDQPEASRSISYVSFSFAPSAADSAAALNTIEELKAEFQETDNPETFVTRNSSNIPFYDGYNSKEKIQIPQKDSIIAAGTGKVYGPYLDGDNYVISRVVDEKVLPDSVRASHILIGMIDPQTQQPVMDDSTASRKADSILALIKGGESFEMLALQLSDDEGSKIKGGDLGYFSSGMMVKEFNDYVFEHKTGEMGIVKTQFGYHIIKVTDQKNFLPSYKIAYMAKAIEPSQETINDAQNKANMFYGNSRDLKAFKENAQKEGYAVMPAPDIAENGYEIPGLGVNRSVVKSIFEKDPGEVLEPEEFNDAFVVIAVTDASEAGLMSAAKARPSVESVLIKEEKAKKISAKIGTPASLDALAQSQGLTVMHADSISFASPMITGAGFEPKVGGYAMNKSALNKISPAIAGNGGVFVVKPESIDARADAIGSIEEVKAQMASQMKNSASYNSTQALRSAAKITDKRSKFI